MALPRAGEITQQGSWLIAFLNLSVLGFLFVLHDKAKRTQHGNGFWEFIDMLPPLWMSSFSVQPVTNPGTSIVMEIVGGRLNELCPRSITLMKIVDHV